MTYRQALEYLESFIDYEKLASYRYKEDFNLAQTESLLAALGSPQKRLKVLHVAGSKGKGSVCADLFSILAAAGCRAGLYTSPHLISFRERIQLAENGRRRMITEREIVELVEKTRPAIDAFAGEPGARKPSFFEVYTALAFIFFSRQEVDFTVAEVGLGGRLDATNVVLPLVAGITPISLEHTDKLGTTYAQIAGEKAGIIKAGAPVVSAPQAPEAEEVIRRVCREKGSRLFLVGKDIRVEEIAIGPEGQRFRVKGIAGEYPDLFTPLLGAHQQENAALAIGMIELLSGADISIPVPAIRDGIQRARWPGRLEKAAERPLIILDGAQNRASAAALAAAVKRFFPGRKIILVFGCSQDKDVEGMATELLPGAEAAILTCADNPRALAPSEIRKRLAGSGREFPLTRTVGEAVALARERAREEDLILITGSLYLVGEAMKTLKIEPYGKDWY